MPYMIKKNDKGEFCVHKKGEDGEATGSSLGCHKSKDDAVAQIGAIESKESDSQKKSVDEPVYYLKVSNSSIDSIGDWDFSQITSQTVSDYTNGTNIWYEVQSNGTWVPTEPFVYEKTIEVEDVENVEEIINEDNPIAIKSLGGGRIGGYAMIWGDEDKKDLHDEFFTPSTKDLTSIFDDIGVLPLIVHHAGDDEVKKFVGGAIDILEYDDVGLWFEAKTKEFEAYRTYVEPLMSNKMAYASSGTLPAAKRVNKMTGEITRWPIAEVSVTWTPAEYRMLEHPLDEIKSAYAELGVSLPNEETDKQADSEKADDQDNLGAEKARLKALVNQELLKLGLLNLD